MHKEKVQARISFHTQWRGSEVWLGQGLQGFIQEFFLGGEHLCAGKLISCGHRPQAPKGVWGHAPPEKF